MLSLEPDNLAQEVQRAEDFRRKHTVRIRSIVSRFIGNWYRVDLLGDATPENTVFAYVAYMLPELWYANPSCRVRPKAPLSDQPVADAMEQALRCWLSETEFTEEGQDVVRDALIGYGAMQVGIEPRDFPGDSRQQRFLPGDGIDASGQVGPYGGMLPPTKALLPFAERISPEQLIIDPRCESPRSARFIGHTYWMDKDQLLADPARWPADQVAQLVESPVDTADENRTEKAVQYGMTADRHRVNLVDLWIPEHGKLVTLARAYNATNTILRSVDYWGPPEGPYEIFGFYKVPGDPYPLSPLQPIMETLEELWVHQQQATEEAKSYKRFILVESGAKTVQKAIMTAESGACVPVDGLTGKYVEVEMGGSPQGRLDHIAVLRDRADRTVGLSDAQRGRIQGKTATESDIVQGNVDTRTSYLRTRINRSVERVLRRVGWYLFFDQSVVMPVTTTDPQSGEVQQGTFLGGVQRGQEGIDWIDFHLDIEPNSMQHSDDSMIQQRSMELMQLSQQVGQGLAMMPQVNWRYIVNMFGESFNQKELFSLLFNPAAMQQPTMLPPGANPALAQGGLGVPGGPGPQWGVNPSMGMIPPGGMGAGGPPAPMGGAGGGMPQQPPFAPRQGGVAPPMGQAMQAPGGMPQSFPMRGAPQGGGALPFAFVGKGNFAKTPRMAKKASSGKGLASLAGGSPQPHPRVARMAKAA